MHKGSTRSQIQKSTQDSQKQDFLKLQNECYLCGKELNTYIEYLPRTYFVVEKAQCCHCMTVVRVKNHSLQ